ncbi:MULTISPECIES: quinoprotein dehydrogenase-associated putative ABC transporter substrate-binding protein [Methylomonas]|uniref:ABC transporter substrate-binding protein n=2 Tax=Methylomonas TaxID=416 RepID=A0A126T6H2_9GAMM|nr:MULTISPECIES: quinoprotein dehydrogenase-associated putative ABC transporter substrate-binding protein [Methylomonas]AMK77640.1 ABC transporter substrate-binding protein [Methylomonas denitrificans]OAH96864.1 ABC transporter substrate-binding protein [Methylomonas methanica]TCV86810.1 amino acid ABC transporter substrate-binding protein (PAAT family) [Methylomonas methanica]
MKMFSTASKLIMTATLAVSTISVNAQDKFRVCADPLNPPYSTKEQTGYENKIAALFAEQLGQELEYTWLPERIGFIRNTLKAENDNGEGFKCDVVMGVPAGYDLTDTSKPYFHSTYVLLIAKGRGWDDIKDSPQLANLPLDRQEKLKIAMFDRGPGTEWLQKSGLLEQGVPYQSMTGDSEHNTAMQIEKDLRTKKIDMVILWGPMAAYVQSQAPKGSYITIPMQSSPGLKFDFSIAMGLRQGDNKRKQQLNELIDKNLDKIQAIIASYNIAVLPIPAETGKKDDD